MTAEPTYLRDSGEGVRLDLVAQPRASRTAFGPLLGERRKLAVAAPPVDGEANAAIVKFLAKFFGVAKSAVRIVQGETGRTKTVAIAGITLAEARRRLGE